MIMAINSSNLFESGSLDHNEDAFLVRETIRQFARLADLAFTFNRLRTEQARDTRAV